MVAYNIFTMCSYKNAENNGQFNDEISRLRKGFIALRIDYQKGVLKTAQGLLRVQKMHKKIAVGSAGHKQ